MTKTELLNLMDKYLIYTNDIDYICDFISTILEKRANELEENEPYATNTIKRYKDATYEVSDLVDYINEILEGE